MSAPERPVPIRAADSTARKITCTRKARETRRHSSTQKQKTARSTSTIPTAAAAGDSGLTGNGPYISRTEIRSSQWGYVDGKTYLLDMYGIMQTGWQNVNGNWYYLNSKGAMQTGWLLKEGKYYFLNTDGTMAYGWVNSQGSWYYFQKPDGDMLTNAYAPDGRYVNAEGVLIQ